MAQHDRAEGSLRQQRVYMSLSRTFRGSLVNVTRVGVQFTDGMVYVDPAPPSDPALLPATVAAALGITAGVERPPAEAIALALRHRQLLLLDTCEHVLAAAGGWRRPCTAPAVRFRS